MNRRHIRIKTIHTVVIGILVLGILRFQRRNARRQRYPGGVQASAAADAFPVGVVVGFGVEEIDKANDMFGQINIGRVHHAISMGVVQKAVPDFFTDSWKARQNAWFG